MVVAGIQRGLKAVVVRPVEVAHLENVAEPGKLCVERPSALRVAAQGLLINVPNAYQICPMVPDIADFQRESWGERMLHVQIPIPHVGSRQILHDAHDWARTGSTGVAVDRTG